MADNELDKQFLDLCSQGLTKVQIAVRLGLQCKDLLSQLTSGVAPRGKELCQVYHEDLMDRMINGEVKADTKEKELQAWRLKTMFKDDWADKKEDKPDSPLNQLSDDEIVKMAQDIIEKYRATFTALQ